MADEPPLTSVLARLPLWSAKPQQTGNRHCATKADFEVIKLP
jgi:hypothetical protein